MPLPRSGAAFSASWFRTQRYQKLQEALQAEASTLTAQRAAQKVRIGQILSGISYPPEDPDAEALDALRQPEAQLLPDTVLALLDDLLARQETELTRLAAQRAEKEAALDALQQTLGRAQQAQKLQQELAAKRAKAQETALLEAAGPRPRRKTLDRADHPPGRNRNGTGRAGRHGYPPGGAGSRRLPSCSARGNAPQTGTEPHRLSAPRCRRQGGTGAVPAGSRPPDRGTHRPGWAGAGVSGRTGGPAGPDAGRGHALPGLRQYPPPGQSPAPPHGPHTDAGKRGQARRH